MESQKVVNNNQSMIAQAKIREHSIETIKAIKDTNSWINEMKQKEKEQLIEKSTAGSVEQQVGKLENLLPPVRSEGTAMHEQTLFNAKAKADIYKESGNRIIKETKNYGEALHYYTKAIYCYDKDAAYFFNRSMCHRNLGAFQECLADYDAALELDPGYSKVYFNRIKVFMELEQYDNALKDYNVLGKVDLQSQKRLQKEYKILLEKTAPKPDWSVFSSKPNCKQIEFIEKAPHLRAKKPLKQLPITEIISPTTNHTYSDAVIDKLFNNNTGEYSPEDNEPSFSGNRYGNYASTSSQFNLFFGAPNAQQQKNNKNSSNAEKELAAPKVTTSKITVTSNATPTNDNDESVDLNLESINLPPLPRTGQQFHTTWAELNDVKKFLYLKNLSAAKDFGTLLGAGFDNEALSDILRIMSKYFIKHGVPVVHILNEITKNDEFKIINMWLTENDKKAVAELLQYMKTIGCTATDIATIKTEFQQS